MCSCKCMASLSWGFSNQALCRTTFLGFLGLWLCPFPNHSFSFAHSVSYLLGSIVAANAMAKIDQAREKNKATWYAFECIQFVHTLHDTSMRSFNWLQTIDAFRFEKHWLEVNIHSLVCSFVRSLARSLFMHSTIPFGHSMVVTFGNNFMAYTSHSWNVEKESTLCTYILKTENTCEPHCMHTFTMFSNTIWLFMLNHTCQSINIKRKKLNVKSN